MAFVTGSFLIRDLKLENIMLDLQNNVKLIDFGLSTKFAADNLLKTSCGSPNYCPPEMLLGQPYCPIKSDVWSAGVCVYYMSAGYLPFEHRSKVKLKEIILKNEVTFPSYVNGHLAQLVTMMLEKEPEKRPSVAEIKANSIFENAKLNEIDSDANERRIEDFMERNGLKYSLVKEEIKNNKFNQNTMIYKLLKKKFENSTESKENKKAKKVYNRVSSTTADLSQILNDSRQLTEQKKRDFSSKFRDLTSSIKAMKKSVCGEELGKKVTVNIRMNSRKASTVKEKENKTIALKRKKTNLTTLIKKKEAEIAKKQKVTNSFMTDLSIAIKEKKTNKMKERNGPSEGFMVQYLSKKSTNYKDN